MTIPIPSALQSLFAKRGFAWSDEIAGRQPPECADADATRRILVLDDIAVATADIDVSASDDPSALFTAISPLPDNERHQLFRSLEGAEYDLVDAVLAAYDRETWLTSKLYENVTSADEVDWDTLVEFRRDGRGARAVLGRQLAEAAQRDETVPPAALRSARTLLDIRARLFRDSVRIAISMAKAGAYELDWVVALSTACMGLTIAIDRFEPSRGYKFSTYAVWWIRAYVSRTRKDDARPLRVPIHVTERVTRFLRAERELWAKLGRPPNPQEVTDLGRAHGVGRWELSVIVRPVIPSRIGAGRDAERIIDPEIRTPAQGGLPDGWVPRFEPIFDAWLAAASSDRKGVDSRVLEILTARLGIGLSNNETLHAIGQTFGVSRERIRQIQEERLERLSRFNREGVLEGEPWTWRPPPDE